MIILEIKGNKQYQADLKQLRFLCLSLEQLIALRFDFQLDLKYQKPITQYQFLLQLFEAFPHSMGYRQSIFQSEKAQERRQGKQYIYLY